MNNLTAKRPVAVAGMQRRWGVLGGAALVLTVAIVSVGQVAPGDFQSLFDTSPSVLLNDDARASNREHRDSGATNLDDPVLMVWRGNAVFTVTTLSALATVTNDLERLPSVERVDSLANAVRIRTDGDDVIVGTYLEPTPRTARQAEAVGSAARAEKSVVGRLVSADGRALMLIIHPVRGLSDSARTQLESAIRALARPAPPGLQVLVTGSTVARSEVSAVLLHDVLWTMPCAMLVSWLVAALGLRRAATAAVPVLVNAGVVACTMAVFLANGHSFNIVTVALPCLVYVLGYAYSMHVVCAYTSCVDDSRATSSTSSTAATVRREVWKPLAIATGTTAVGFLSLCMSDVEAVRAAGRYATLGTLLAYFAALVVVPEGLAHSTTRRPALRPARLAKLAAGLCRFGMQRRRLVLVLAGLIGTAGMVGTWNSSVDTSYLRALSDTNVVKQAYERTERAFGGITPFTISLQAERTNAFAQPEVVSAVDDLVRWLVAEPGVSGVYSLIDFYQQVLAAVDPEEEVSTRGVPGTASLARQLLVLFANRDTERLVDRNAQHMDILVRSSLTASTAIAALSARIERRLHDLPPGIRFSVHGEAIDIARSIDAVALGQVRSIAVTFVILALVFAAQLGSARASMLAMLPNLLPVLIVGGVMSCLAIDINLCTSLVGPVVMAVAVDDSIHLLSRLSTGKQAGMEAQEAMRAAVNGLARPITLTSAGLVTGFLAMLASDLTYLVQFGVLAALALALAWLCDLTLIPALCSHLASPAPAASRHLRDNRVKGYPGIRVSAVPRRSIVQFFIPDRRTPRMDRFANHLSAALLAVFLLGTVIAVVELIERTDAASGMTRIV